MVQTYTVECRYACTHVFSHMDTHAYANTHMWSLWIPTDTDHQQGTHPNMCTHALVTAHMYTPQKHRGEMTPL